MATISRRDVLTRMQRGVDMACSTHHADAQHKPALAALDKNKDGKLSGRRELSRVHRYLSRLSKRDQKSNGRSAERLLSALLRCRLEPRSRAAVAKAALELQRTRSNEFAKEKAPTSINPQLDRNQKPGKTKLSWMRGAYKCNFFVGEALSKSGYVMPLSDKHRYAGAGSLHSHRRYFQRIVSPADLRPGDVVTLRWPGKGNAHAAIVTKTGKRKGTIEITGTGRGSVVTEKVSAHLGKDWHEALSTAKYDSKHQRFVLKAADGTRFHVYLLRPKRKR